MNETIVLYDGFAVPAPGVNTGIISGGIVMANNLAVRALSFIVDLNTSSVFNVTVTQAGVKKTMSLLLGATFTANMAYGPFLLPVGPGDTVNFEVPTDGIINRLYVEGVTSGAR